MAVRSERVVRSRRLAATPALFLKVAAAAAIALYVIVVSGATVRLTASGLGCEGWPGCEPGAFFPASNHHAFVEFGNRVVAIFPLSLTLVSWLVARRVAGLPRWATWLAFFTFAGTLAQAPLGRVTVLLDLHPLMVMTHFLLSMVVLAAAVIVVLEAWSLVRGQVPQPLGRLSRGGLAVGALCAVLLVSGALATAAGPHSGGEGIRRYGTLLDSMEVHVRVAGVYGIALLVLVGVLWRRRADAPRLFRAGLLVLGLTATQAIVGEVQWRTHLPWGLVLVHVALAAAVWATAVALAYVLARSPTPLART